MRCRRLLSALCACLLLPWTPGGAAARQAEEHRVLFRDAPAATDAETRLAADAQLAMRRLDHWLRPFPFETLTIVGEPWFSPRVGYASGGAVVVPEKMLAAARDRAPARTLVAGLTKLYWPGTGTRSSFSAGVRDYVTTRVFHDQFSGTHYFTVNLIGGFATHAVRPVTLTRRPFDHRPPVRHFPETASDPAVQRIVDALFTLERYVGWPTLQYAVSDWLARDASASSLEQFEDSLARAASRDLRWFTRTAFAPDATFDYAASPPTSSVVTSDGWHDVSATVVRNGSASFPIEIEVVFADGSRRRERWDGREPNITFDYRSRTPITAVVVDPDLVLLLDADRRDNAYVERAPLHVPAVRWTLQWATWLQNVLMTVV